MLSETSSAEVKTIFTNQTMTILTTTARRQKKYIIHTYIHSLNIHIPNDKLNYQLHFTNAHTYYIQMAWPLLQLEYTTDPSQLHHTQKFTIITIIIVTLQALIQTNNIA